MFGRYRLDRLIRDNASTEVFEASVVGEGGFARRVLLKRLKTEVAREPGAVRAFEAEAQVMGRVYHPNVVGVLDFGVADGLPYQILEHVDGMDLLRLEARCRDAGRPLDDAAWVAILAEAGHGLETLHQARDDRGRALGIVHGRLGPAQVVVSLGGDVKLLLDRGPSAIAADARGDVRALCATLARMLAGPPPVEEDRPDPPLLPELDRALGDATSASAFVEGCGQWLKAKGIVDGRLLVREAMLARREVLEPKTGPVNVLAALAAPVFAEITDKTIDRGLLAGQLDAAPAPDAADVSTPAPTYDDATRVDPLPPDQEVVDQATQVEPIEAVDLTTDGQQLAPELRAPEPTIAQPPDEPDDAVDPPGYRLIAPLAEGGFAKVFRAERIDTGAAVAVKLLRDERREHPAAAARFDREARLLSKLESPYLVRLLDSGRLADGRPWMAMELLDGRTLGQEIYNARGPLPAPRVRRIARDLALGLAALHEAGIVHRDLGPRNVMLVEVNGREKAMIIDLGHARWTASRPESALTRPGLVLGNARWMAPEQIHDPSKAGPAADLYSLGLLILAMVTGQAPYSGSPNRVLARQLSETPEVPPSPFSALIRRLIDKDPVRRWASASAVAAELTQIAIPATRPPPESFSRTAPEVPLNVPVRAPQPIPMVHDDRTAPVPPPPATRPLPAVPVMAPEPDGSRWWIALAVIAATAMGWALMR